MRGGAGSASVTCRQRVLGARVPLAFIKRQSHFHKGWVSLLSKSMEQNFQKQQEFMLLNGRLQLERQLLMQNQMRERQMAMQVAWSREFLKYFGSFFSLATLGLTIGAVKKRKAALLAPVVPLSFILVYQMDMAYGSLIHRMRAEAESIMVSESERLDLPHGTPTFESIEKSRRTRAHLSSLLEK